MVKTFKERWNEVDERCPHCNQVTKRVIGINKQNLKKLFSKPTLQDMMIFIMLVACLFLTWAYYNDISQYKAILDNPREFCISYSEKSLINDNLNISLEKNENEYRNSN